MKGESVCEMFNRGAGSRGSPPQRAVVITDATRQEAHPDHRMHVVLHLSWRMGSLSHKANKQS